MITAKELELIKEAASREDTVDWDIPGGSILFGKNEMTVYRYQKRKWFSKHVDGWKNMNLSQLTAALKNQEWREKK